MPLKVVKVWHIAHESRVKSFQSALKSPCVMAYLILQDLHGDGCLDSTPAHFGEQATSNNACIPVRGRKG